ncbi:hypothetical protein G6675_09390 [Polynucleobacter paneuropaeus]|nr:hypothetical protein [Polynucleobacter paneuropaeus]
MKFLIFIIFMFGASWSMADDRISDKEIKKTLIQQSIRDYGKSCPCPYSKSPKGGQCGLNSAYSKTGRLAILCYPSNVTKTMIKEYRDKNGL